MSSDSVNPPRRLAHCLLFKLSVYIFSGNVYCAFLFLRSFPFKFLIIPGKMLEADGRKSEQAQPSQLWLASAAQLLFTLQIIGLIPRALARLLFFYMYLLLLQEWTEHLFRYAVDLRAHNACPLALLDKAHSKLLTQTIDGKIPVKK